MNLAAALRLAAAGVSQEVDPPPVKAWPGHQPGRVYLGTSEPVGREVQNTVQEIGQDLGLEREFYINNSSASAEDAFIVGAHNRNRIPWISWKVSQTDATIQADWASINTGSQDAAITARANRYKALVKPIIVTWNGQPDRDGTTSAHGTAFRTAFKRIAGRFTAAGATNVAFVPIMSDYLWHGETIDGSAGDLSWWLDDEMLTLSAFLGLRSDKNLQNATFADRLPIILSDLDVRGFPDLMVGIGLSAGFDTTSQTGAAWWADSWDWVEQNSYRVAAVTYHNTNADPPPLETGSTPAAPQNLNVSVAATDTQVTLAWDAALSLSTVTSYRIYRNGTFLKTAGTSLSNTVTGLTAGTTYSFTVSASNEWGEGPKSSALSVTTTGGGGGGGVTPGSTVIVYAAGDIATPWTGNMAHDLTGDLIEASAKDAVIALGDLAYNDGLYTEFMGLYDPHWGPFKSITYPAPGNHEYNGSSTAAGYRQYFGSRVLTNGSPWYSFNLGAWHFISLDSDVTPAAQLLWLEADLAANANNPATKGLCAFWHHPRWTSTRGGSSSVQPFIDRLRPYKTDLILMGHDHAYERFNKLSASGAADAAGIRHFVIGTGGRGLYPLGTIHPQSQVRIHNQWGVVKFTFTSTDYSWLWRPVPGSSGSDSGTTAINPK